VSIMLSCCTAADASLAYAATIPRPLYESSSFGHQRLYTKRLVIHQPPFGRWHLSDQLTLPLLCMWPAQHRGETEAEKLKGTLVENSNSGKKSFDSIRFGNLINLPLVH